MKSILITVSVILLLFVVFQTYWSLTVSETEKYPYEVIKKIGEVSIRKYDARNFISVKMDSEVYEESSKKGFSILASYIFGANGTNEKISMTSPVSISLDDNMTMMFMVPEKYELADLPKPNNSNIQFKQESERNVAVIRFGGWSSSVRIEKYKKILRGTLDKKGIPYSNKFFFLGYNPPFEVFNRRNEIIVELFPDFDLKTL